MMVSFVVFRELPWEVVMENGKTAVPTDEVARKTNLKKS